MLTTTSQRGFTEDQLMALPHLGKAELIDGRIIMSPAGYRHGVVASRLLARLLMHVERYRQGLVSDSSTGFRMKGGNVLSPDVSFVAADRLRGLNRLPRGYFDGAPDLAAEILSPNDPPGEVEQKTKEYFDNGLRLLWMVDPERRTIAIHHPPTSSPQPTRTLRSDDTLDGEGVVPDFRLPLNDLFAGPDFG